MTKNILELMMENTSLKKEVIGKKIKSSFWSGSKKNNYTVQIFLNNFKGRVGIQATLAENPEEKDWFPIFLNTTKEFLEFSENDNSLNESSRKILTFNFQGNFIWLRAVMDRKNISQEINDNNISEFGIVEQILLAK